jgi:tol-pal system protein YbgF
LKHRFLALALLPLLGACATKRDLRDLRTEVQALQSSNQELLTDVQRQNAQALDSLTAQLIRMRGDFTAQNYQMEQLLVQVMELTGQSQARLNELREQLRQRGEALGNGGSATGPAAAPAGNPDELFNAALASLRRGSFSTARAGFEEFLRSHPRHANAADAQFYIGETFYEARDFERAWAAYGRVLELYPASPRASTALYKAALISLEQGNRDRARVMFNQVVSAYPRSEEAPLARQQLQQMGR